MLELVVACRIDRRRLLLVHIFSFLLPPKQVDQGLAVISSSASQFSGLIVENDNPWGTVQFERTSVNAAEDAGVIRVNIVRSNGGLGLSLWAWTLRVGVTGIDPATQFISVSCLSTIIQSYSHSYRIMHTHSICTMATRTTQCTHFFASSATSSPCLSVHAFSHRHTLRACGSFADNRHCNSQSGCSEPSNLSSADR